VMPTDPMFCKFSPARTLAALDSDACLIGGFTCIFAAANRDPARWEQP